ncbi:membrane-associated Zn-dependent protease 1 [Yersinia sp. Marseille-Q3913]|uniref:membrane-associated Zn-dependent protease 1 n=1 Tax=Yersinia sp. Marseille-Q3913 TaxID=2830769 RepID=UPI001BB0C749|nr:membrane-associated Zn-dependent protease 1 [Yersinia sp. Marseille-Q3913]MBS0053896.1 membrane-associated Zn-dependent protease 1 [Yersinia sp. Marseille-Q3913]
MKGYRYVRGLILLIGVFLSSPLWGKGEVHLLFHMGAGAGGQFFVGGTLVNTGDTAVAGGYLVIIPVGAHCQLALPKLQTFGPLAPGEKVGFRAAVDIPLTDYHLASFAAYDDMGFPLPVVDETREIIKVREPEQRKACSASRQASDTKNSG